MRITFRAALLSLLAAPAFAQAPAPKPAPAAPAAPVAPAAPAAAAVPVPQMDLATYLVQPAVQAQVAAAARDQMRQAPGGCVGASFQPTNQVLVLSPARFEDGKPVTGAWSQRVTATGCGPVHTLNILTIIHPDATTQVVAMMPGDTHTDPVMQKNALEYAQAIALRAAPPGCKQLAFVDTAFDGFSGLPSPEVKDGRESRPWREVWTLAACGNLYDVHLVFTPNARGTALAGDNPVKHPG